MSLIRISKTIYVKDQYGITRQAFVEGDEIEENVYRGVIARETVLNPEDLEGAGEQSLSKEEPSEEAEPVLETKMLEETPEEAPVEEAPVEEAVPESDKVEPEVKPHGKTATKGKKHN